ncbi:MAG: putative DNA binding domain-containing protein [Leptospiraceae bacterium]|nr:putative DNA binding domain-containing protein [Leptospiraceae bacterium]MCP5502476.1 putative DNA binding domain-containing protein [Leptospiraceae bacterium]
MDEILQLQERVRNAILVGESDFREFKSALEGKPDNKKPGSVKRICEKISEALVAFANTDGGELLIGVEDDTTITGVPHSEKEILMMLNSIRTHVMSGQKLPMVYALKVKLDNKFVLFFQVEKGSSEIYQLPDGRVVVRKDKRTVPANVRRLQFERQEVKSREYDRKFVDGASISDLDLPLIQNLADGFLKGLTVEKYLQQIGLAEYAINGLRLREAALLLFAKDINRWHPRSQVRFLKVKGSSLESGEKYNVVSDETVHGNIFELIIKSWERLRPYLAYKTEFGADARFEQKYIYPEDACKEAILNAIVHRDYNNSNGIEVYIYDDRMDIRNPGALLSTLTVEDLYILDNRHESRNARITNVLKISKFMREIGEGMKRIFRLMEQSELKRPILYSNTNWFTVTLFNKSVYTPKQEQFINLFSAYPLSHNQKQVILLGMEGKAIAPHDIYLAMNTADRDTYDKEVSGLRKMKLLQEIRTNAQASIYAKKNQISKQKVHRFKVRLPNTGLSDTKTGN